MIADTPMRIMRAYRAGLIVAGIASAVGIRPSDAQMLPPDAGAAPGVGAPAAGAETQTAPAAAAGPRWQIVPRLELRETYTDNAALGTNGQNTALTGSRESDFITSLQPGIRVTGQSARAQLDFDYSLRFDKYASQDELDNFSHALTYLGSIELYRQSLFVDTRAAVSEQSATGANPVGVTDRTVPNDRVTTGSFQVSPYYRTRFGDWATGEVRYSLTETIASGDSSVDGSTAFGNTAEPGNALTNQIAGSLGTGERFGRFSSTLLTEYIDTSSSGAAASSTREIVNVANSYSLSRELTLLGSFGYEDVVYSVPLTTDLTGPTWRAGVRLTPGPRATLTVTYGRSAGFDGFDASGSYEVGAATRFVTSYTDTVATNQELIGQNLTGLGRSDAGQVINTRTGLPFALNNTSLPIDNSVFRDRSLTAGALTSIGRNDLSLTFSREERQVISSPPAPDQISTGLSFAWARATTPVMTVSAVAGYQVVDRGLGFGTENVASVGASIAYQMTETLTASLSYTHFDRFGGDTPVGSVSGDLSENSLVLSLRKQF